MILYRERLTPPILLYVALLLVIPASLLVFLPINVFVGVAFAIALYAACTLALFFTAPVIVVTDESFAAGSAVLPLTAVGSASAYAGAEATAQRGPKLDARAWLVIRGWVGPVVKVTVDDQGDPTPYWLVSSRKPDALVAALQQIRPRTPGR